MPRIKIPVIIKVPVIGETYSCRIDARIVERLLISPIDFDTMLAEVGQDIQSFALGDADCVTLPAIITRSLRSISITVPNLGIAVPFDRSIENLYLIINKKLYFISEYDVDIVQLAGTSLYKRAKAQFILPKCKVISNVVLYDAPTSLAINNASSNQLVITWASVTGCTGYRLFASRSPLTEGEYDNDQMVADEEECPNGTETYTMKALTTGHRYYFRVVAVDSVGEEGAHSDQVSKEVT